MQRAEAWLHLLLVLSVGTISPRSAGTGLVFIEPIFYDWAIVFSRSGVRAL